jgi:hypothetical protein
LYNIKIQKEERAYGGDEMDLMISSYTPLSLPHEGRDRRSKVLQKDHPPFQGDVNLKTINS